MHPCSKSNEQRVTQTRLMEKRSYLSSSRVVAVLAFLWSTTFCDGYDQKVLCRGEEREALLRFKAGFPRLDASQPVPLPSWRSSSTGGEGEDCCGWEGVVCHNVTSHVLKLLLRDSSLEGGHISDSLLELQHLQHLDLSQNYFGLGESGIPKFIGSLTSLRYLNLSGSYFSGAIPPELGNLSRLQYLDIRGGWALKSKDVGWISGLTSLKFLDMIDVDLSKASNWLQVLLNKLNSLSVLRLSDCRLDDTHRIDPHVNFSSSPAPIITHLDLSFNNLINLKLDLFSYLPTSLVELDLSSNGFHGPIPTGLANLTSLRFLDLSYNGFTSNIPHWLLSRMVAIETLALSNNQFQGKLPSGIFENLTSLTHLDLSFNALEGEIPPSLGTLCNSSYVTKSKRRSLEVLVLDNNKFSGHLPGQLGQYKSLSTLWIWTNSLIGALPMSIGGLSSLSDLDISSNLLEGVVTEKHFANLTKLQYLDAAFNKKLTLQVTSNWFPAFQLVSLLMSGWHLGPQFPIWLQQSALSLQDLDISNTGISDFVPDWFWRSMCANNIDPTDCRVDLSHNKLKGSLPNLNFRGFLFLGSNSLTGSLPQISSSVVTVDLSHNSFTGSLSHVLCTKTDDDGYEYNMLTELDLSGNFLVGELPNCWQNWTELGVLKLGDIQFTGSIPASMGSLLSLSSLQLCNNYLSGTLPSLENYTGLMHLDLSENGFSGSSVPVWVGNNLSNLMVLSLSSNRFSGPIPPELCRLHSLQILDLRDNGLSSSVPTCFSNFAAMIRQTNSAEPFVFSSSSLSGAYIPTELLIVKRMRNEYGSNLGLLTGIDLSRNKLSGEIPKEITTLHRLIFLDLSGNDLQGEIPKGIGSMKSLESLDLSMNKLSSVIPQTISSISFLSYLNVSFNNLSGKIPTGTQIQGFSPLSFIGNHDLYGPPLTINEAESSPMTQDQLRLNRDEDEDEDEDDGGWMDDIKYWFYMSTPLGFVVGFWAIWGPLAFSKAWRYAYFRFLEDSIIYKIFNY